MIRNIKVLGLAFVAVAAMSMTAAGAAQASQLHAATAGPNAAITGEQYAGGLTNKFRLTPPNGPVVECTQAHLDTVGLQKEGGAVPKTAQHGTVYGQYTGCTFVGQPATIQMNGCKYTLAGTATANTWEVDIVGCTAGKQIVVSTGGFCEIRVEEQTSIGGHIFFTQTGQDLTADITATGITYQVTGPLCGHTNNVTTHDGEYQGSLTVRAYEDLGNTVQKTHDGHQATLRNKALAVAPLTTT